MGGIIETDCMTGLDLLNVPTSLALLAMFLVFLEVFIVIFAKVMRKKNRTSLFY